METNFPMDNADEHMKFKSYYVVWKQQENKDFLLPCNRLNRTMQYGN